MIATTPGMPERDDLARQNRRTANDPTREAAVNDRAKQMPSSYRGGYLRAVEGEASPREAIKAHCLECVGWVRGEVTQCTARACPLWAYRPTFATTPKEVTHG
jgi:hypothetical protein